MTLSFRLGFLFASLYATQYIASGFLSVALIALLREQGASLSQLGLVNLVMLPLSLKFLWAPLVDKYGKKQIGHYRSWLIPIQLLLFFQLIIISFLDPAVDIIWLLIILCAFSATVGTQDLAVDGLACTTISKGERHKINSIQVGSGMSGNIIGGGMMLIFYPSLGWQNSILIIATLSVIPWLLLYFFKEKYLIQNRISEISGWKYIFLFWKDKLGWLFIIFCYTCGFSAFATVTPTLVDAKWSLPEIGMVIRIFGAIVGLCSAIFIVKFLKRWGRKKSIVILTFIESICLLLLLLPAMGKTEPVWVYLSVGAYFLCFSPLYAAITSVMMDHAANSPYPTTTYTIQYSVAMLLSLLGSASLLWFAQYIGYSVVISLSVFFALIASGYSYFYFRQGTSNV